MDTIIIYCHPKDPAKENKLLKAILFEIEHAGHSAKVYNIVGDVFSPQLMSSQPVELPKSERVNRIIKLIQLDIYNSRHILFLFPHHWNDLSAYVRRFVDKVFLSEWGGSQKFAAEKKLKNLKATIITSLRIPQLLFNPKDANGLDPFTVSILKLCGIHNIKWFNIGIWSDRNSRIRVRKIQKIREYISRI